MVFNLQRYEEVSTLLSLVSVFWSFVVGFWTSLASNGKKSVIFARLIYHNSMNMGQLKEKYERFKQWQQQPMKFHMSEETHRCNNCGMEFSGNYCPCCSQRAGVGRIGWRSVRQGIMDIWGLGTRSLLYSIWQLLWRPGHFINDYINGKRQVSFPPVKMLFIVAVIYTLVVYWFLPHVLGLDLVQIEKSFTGANAESALEWSRVNYGWFLMVMSACAIIPTWVLFRESPRNHHHTLPEGFFIQVLLSVILVVLAFFITPLAFQNYYAYMVVVFIISFFYYFVSYKQLFGYGTWGTLWRQVFVMISMLYFMGAFMFSAFDMSIPVNGTITPEQSDMYRLGVATSSIFIGLVVLVVGFVINYVATRKVRKQARLENQSLQGKVNR